MVNKSLTTCVIVARSRIESTSMLYMSHDLCNELSADINTLGTIPKGSTLQLCQILYVYIDIEIECDGGIPSQNFHLEAIVSQSERSL